MLTVFWGGGYVFIARISQYNSFHFFFLTTQEKPRFEKKLILAHLAVFSFQALVSGERLRQGTRENEISQVEEALSVSESTGLSPNRCELRVQSMLAQRAALTPQNMLK